MIYTRWGSKIVFTRHITTTDEVEQVENRKSDSHDVERLEVDAYMAGRLFEIDEKERLFDLSLVRADGGWQEVRAAIEAVGGHVFNAKQSRRKEETDDSTKESTS